MTAPYTFPRDHELLPTRREIVPVVDAARGVVPVPQLGIVDEQAPFAAGWWNRVIDAIDSMERRR